MPDPQSNLKPADPLPPDHFHGERGNSRITKAVAWLIAAVLLAGCALQAVTPTSEISLSTAASETPTAGTAERLTVETFSLSKGDPQEFSLYADVLRSLAQKDGVNLESNNQVITIKAEAGENKVNFALMPFAVGYNLIDPDGKPSLPKPIYFLAYPDDQGNMQGGYVVGDLIETDEKGRVSFTARMIDPAAFENWKNNIQAPQDQLGQLIYVFPLKQGITVEQARQILKDFISGKIAPEQFGFFTVGGVFLQAGKPDVFVSFENPSADQPPTQAPDLLQQVFERLFGATPAAAAAAPIPLPTPTPTEVPIPTLSPDLVGGIEGIPDPRVSNPELFDLKNPDAPIPQFVNAMKMAGIEVTGEEVAVGITYQELKDKDGNPFVVTVYNLDPDPATTGETLEGPIPLIIAEKEEMGWKWEKINGFKQITEQTYRKIGSEVSQFFINNDPLYRETFLTNYNFASTSGDIFRESLFDKIPTNTKLSPEQIVALYDWRKADNILSAAEKYDIPLNIHHLFGRYYDKTAPSWLKNMSDSEIQKWMELHTKAISERVKQHNVVIEGVDVYNEVFFGNKATDYITQRLGVDSALTLAFNLARQYFGPGVVLRYLDNVYYGKRSNFPHNEESDVIFKKIKTLKEAGVPIDEVSDHGHKVLRDFLNISAIATYQNQLRELAEKYRQIGVKFEVGESDLNINGASQEQLAFGYLLFLAEIKLLNEGVLEHLGFWGFTPDISWMKSGGGYPKEYDPNPIPLMPFERDHKTPNILYYLMLKALFNL